MKRAIIGQKFIMIDGPKKGSAFYSDDKNKKEGVKISRCSCGCGALWGTVKNV